MKLKVLDLFSGIGGFSLGLETAGMETVAFCEIEKFPSDVLNKHWPMIPNLGDITKLTGEEIYERVGKIDVICGGFPCQSVSVAGKREGFENKSKSGLWYEYKRLIEEIKPRWIIIENVRNLLNIGFAEVIKDLCDLGYDAEWEVISARSVGARHLRERIWIVAYPHGEFLREQSVGKQKCETETVSGVVSKKARDLANADSERLEGLRGLRKASKVCAQEKASPCDRRDISNTDMPRLWPTFATTEEAQWWWAKATACISAKWEARPSFRGVVDGLSARMERRRRKRIKALGNSIVPQIAYLIGKRIVEVEGASWVKEIKEI